MKRLIPIFLLAFALVGAAFAENAKSNVPLKQYTLNVPGTKLEGIVQARLAFGAPGFGEDPDNDSHEVYLVLVLKTAISVKPSEATESSHPEVKEVQLVQSKWKNGELANKTVIVAGTLFEKNTAHHRTDVLIFADSVELVKVDEVANDRKYVLRWTPLTVPRDRESYGSSAGAPVFRRALLRGHCKRN